VLQAAIAYRLTGLIMENTGGLIAVRAGSWGGGMQKRPCSVLCRSSALFVQTSTLVHTAVEGMKRAVLVDPGLLEEDGKEKDTVGMNRSFFIR